MAHSCHSLYYFGGRQYFAESNHSPRNICGTQSIPPVYEVAGVASCTFISAQIVRKRRESRDAFGIGVFSTVSPWASGRAIVSPSPNTPTQPHTHTHPGEFSEAIIVGNLIGVFEIRLFESIPVVEVLLI